MNIDFINNDYRFNARTSALIFNKDYTKVLLFNVEGRSHYLLPGGRIEQLEESLDAIKRELKEEIGWDNSEFSFLALSEEFVHDKGYDYHQLNIIYKAIYNNEIKENKFKGLEGDWINFEWIDVSDISKYNIYPHQIKDAIKNPNGTYHFVENLIKKNG